jgi:hypothetical protein
MRFSPNMCVFLRPLTTPFYHLLMVTKVLAEGKGIIARRCLKKAGVQSCDPTCLCGHADKRTETAHKAEFKEGGVGTGGEKFPATRLDGF